MPTAASEQAGRAPGLAAIGVRRPRIFSTPRGRPRFRRGSDVVLLVPAAIALAALIAAYPPSRFERSLDEFLDSFPSWLDPVWSLFYDALALWAILLVLAALLGRRRVVTLQAIASIVLGAAVAVGAARLALGRWPELEDVLLLRVDDSTFPVIRVAVTAATILAIAPHLVRPLQKLGRWVLLLGLVGAVLVEAAPPSAAVSSVLVAVVAASVVRLAFGTSAGHPESADVEAALAELGVPVGRLEPAARQPAGVFVARGEDDRGRSLRVKVYGRDAYDTQLVARLGRALWYRDEGLRLRLSRLDAVEHEALLTLLARQAGVPTAEVVVAAESHGDALLVLHDSSRPLAGRRPEEVEDEQLASAWKSLGQLADARIAHLRVGLDTVVTIGDRVGLVDFDHGTLAPRPERHLTDRAQLLATTAVLVGPERAVAAAVKAVGADGVATLLPFLQPAALGGPLRRSLEESGLDADDLRDRAAAAVGVEPPQLVQFRRVTWWSAAQLLLLVFAVSTVVGALSGLDYEAFSAQLQDASWAWIAFGLVLAQLPRVTQAISTLGSVAASLPFVPVYAMQLATSYMNLALPSNLARMAINIRFFQRQGIPPAPAVTAGAIDSFASTFVQAVLLVGLLLSSASSLDLDLDLPEGPPVRALIVLATLVVAATLALVLVRRVRRAIADLARRWWPDVRDAVRGLRASNKLALLLGGSLLTEILFAATLGVFANALGYDVGLADLLVINISVSLLASLLPVPGGIGIAEFGLTVGLVSAGLPEEAALATALLYRGATFYIPPIWGFFAMRWLQRNALI